MFEFMKKDVKFGLLVKHLTDDEWKKYCSAVVPEFAKAGIKVLGLQSGFSIQDANDNDVMEADIVVCTATKAIFRALGALGYSEIGQSMVDYPVFS